jgi:polyisoprenoid-binding protein YceI
MANLAIVFGDPASVGVWTLVAERSTIGFAGKSMWGLLSVKGRFTEFSGDGQITGTQTVFGRVDIKAASIDTKIRRRDKDLRARWFFDVARYPDISLVVTNVEHVTSDTADLQATLSIKDITKPVSLRVELAGASDSEIRLTTRTTINRKDFGVGGTLAGVIRPNVTLTGDMVFRR